MIWPRVPRFLRRGALMCGLIVVLLLTGTGVATARWIIAATTDAVVTAGQLRTELSGTAGLGASNMSPNQFTSPVALTVLNPNPVPVNYTLTFTRTSGTLTRAEVGLTLWQAAGTTCPATVPTTGTATGTLAAPPAIPVTGAPGGSATVVCAATRFTGTLATSGGRSLTVTPTLTARMTTGSWTATATGAPFTHTIAPAPISAPGPVTNLTCTNVGTNPGTAGIQLAWNSVPGATGYRIISSTGRIRPDVTTPSVFVTISQGDRPVWLEIVALGTGGTSLPVRQNVHVTQVPALGNTLRCGSQP